MRRADVVPAAAWPPDTRTSKAPVPLGRRISVDNSALPSLFARTRASDSVWTPHFPLSSGVGSSAGTTFLDSGDPIDHHVSIASAPDTWRIPTHASVLSPLHESGSPGPSRECQSSVPTILRQESASPSFAEPQVPAVTRRILPSPSYISPSASRSTSVSEIARRGSDGLVFPTDPSQRDISSVHHSSAVRVSSEVPRSSIARSFSLRSLESFTPSRVHVHEDSDPAAIMARMSLSDINSDLIGAQNDAASRTVRRSPYAVDTTREVDLAAAAHEHEAPPSAFDTAAPLFHPNTSTFAFEPSVPPEVVPETDTPSFAAPPHHAPPWNTLGFSAPLLLSPLAPMAPRAFVLKSFTEVDVERSIRHGVWTSTAKGNARLNRAWSAYANMGAIYLFFSVNGSGRFCGVAQMTSGLDYSRSSDIWAEGYRWKGLFHVRWLIVKDVLNHQLRHITLQSTSLLLLQHRANTTAPTEVKPVTQSRDTQELFPDVAMAMLNVFYTYAGTCSLLC